jgi:hypothetical protein
MITDKEVTDFFFVAMSAIICPALRGIEGHDEIVRNGLVNNELVHNAKSFAGTAAYANRLNDIPVNKSHEIFLCYFLLIPTRISTPGITFSHPSPG